MANDRKSLQESHEETWETWTNCAMVKEHCNTIPCRISVSVGIMFKSMCCPSKIGIWNEICKWWCLFCHTLWWDCRCENHTTLLHLYRSGGGDGQLSGTLAWTFHDWTMGSLRLCYCKTRSSMQEEKCYKKLSICVNKHYSFILL